MWGRATLTMVASSTTIIWAVRMTARSTEGLRRHRRCRCENCEIEPLTATFPLVF